MAGLWGIVNQLPATVTQGLTLRVGAGHGTGAVSVKAERRVAPHSHLFVLPGRLLKAANHQGLSQHLAWEFGD